MDTAQTLHYGAAVWYKLQWVNADITALAGTNGQIAIATLPALTVVKRVWIQVTGQAAGPTTVTASVGPVGALTAYVLAGSLKAAANTLYGDAAAEQGVQIAGVGGSAVSSLTSTTAIQMDVTSSVGNLSTVTGSTGLVWIETTQLP